MSKKDLILQAADAIADRLYPGPTSYCIGTLDDVILCLPPYVLPKDFKLVRKYHAQMLDKGLSPAHWSDLEKALIEHFETEGLCPNNQTH